MTQAPSLAIGEGRRFLLTEPKEDFVAYNPNIRSGSSMASLPGLTQLRWHQRKAIAEVVASVPPIATVLVTAWIYFHDPAKRLGSYWLLGAAVWLAIGGMFKVWQANQEDRKRQEKESPQDLIGCVMVLHRTVCQFRGIGNPNDKTLRITIHRVVPAKSAKDEPQELEQILPYIGTPGGGVGRRTSIHCGVVGRAIREKEPVVLDRQTENYEDYIAELVQTLGYTRSQAQALTLDRWSAFGVPVYDVQSPDNVIGVMFLDSSRQKFFSKETVRLILGACHGINEYVSRRFSG